MGGIGSVLFLLYWQGSSAVNIGPFRTVAAMYHEPGAVQSQFDEPGAVAGTYHGPGGLSGGGYL